MSAVPTYCRVSVGVPARRIEKVHAVELALFGKATMLVAELAMVPLPIRWNFAPSCWGFFVGAAFGSL